MPHPAKPPRGRRGGSSRPRPQTRPPQPHHNFAPPVFLSAGMLDDTPLLPSEDGAPLSSDLGTPDLTTPTRRDLSSLAGALTFEETTRHTLPASCLGSDDSPARLGLGADCSGSDELPPCHGLGAECCDSGDDEEASSSSSGYGDAAIERRPRQPPPAPASSALGRLLRAFAAEPLAVSLTIQRPSGRSAASFLGEVAWCADELGCTARPSGDRPGELTICRCGAEGDAGSAPQGGRSGRRTARTGDEPHEGEWWPQGGGGRSGGKKSAHRTMPKHLRKALRRAKWAEGQPDAVQSGSSRASASSQAARGGGTPGGPRSTSSSMPPGGIQTTRGLLAIGDDNVGHQMLVKMGWTGGALAGGALAEPLSVDVHTRRSGLGS